MDLFFYPTWSQINFQFGGVFAIIKKKKERKKQKIFLRLSLLLLLWYFHYMYVGILDSVPKVWEFFFVLYYVFYLESLIPVDLSSILLIPSFFLLKSEVEPLWRICHFIFATFSSIMFFLLKKIWPFNWHSLFDDQALSIFPLFFENTILYILYIFSLSSRYNM